MLSTLRARLTYANVMVTILAFFVFGSGTAVAAVIITSNSQVAAHTIAGAKAAAGINKNVIPGSLAGSDLATGTVTAANIAAANKDGAAGTPSLRTLGNGPLQAPAGNDPRLAKGVIAAIEYELSGPLPTQTLSFTVHKAGDWLLITWSGTGFRNSTQGPGQANVDLLIDGGFADHSFLFFNNVAQHLPFPTAEATLMGLSPGTHTIGFGGTPSVTSDDQDGYFATIVEVQPNP